MRERRKGPKRGKGKAIEEETKRRRIQMGKRLGELGAEKVRIHLERWRMVKGEERRSGER